MALPFGLGTKQTPNTSVKTSTSLPFGIQQTQSTSLPFGIKTSLPTAPQIDNSPVNLLPNGSQPNAINAGLTAAKQSLQQAPPASFNPVDWAKEAGSAFKGAIVNAGNKWSDVITNFGKESTSKFAGDVIGADTATVGALFAPISSIFQATQKVPGVVGIASRGINAIFAGIAGASGQVAVNMLNQIPSSVLTDESKKTLETPIREAAGLVGQLIVGKGSADTTKVLSNHVNTILDSFKGVKPNPSDVKLPVQSQSAENPIKINTPKTKQAAYAASQGYEPIIPESQLPTIDMGAKAKETVPTIQTETPSSSNLPKGLTYEPIIGTKIKSDLPDIKVSIPSDIPKGNGLSMADEISAPKDVSQTSLKVQQAAKENKMNVPQENLSKIKNMNMSAESVKARDIIQKNPVEAMKSIEKGLSPSSEVRPQTIFTELVNKAAREGDVKTINELSRSSIGTETAQGLKALDNIDLEANPVKAISQLRATKIKSSKVKNADIAAKKEVDKSISDYKRTSSIPSKNIRTWTDLMRSIQC